MRKYLGETNWGTQGANSTSVDFAFRFRRTDDMIQVVLGECKYTEDYTAPLPKPGEINRTRLRVYREAFNRSKAYQPDLPPYDSFFVEPFYQFMRQTLLARELEAAREMDADIVILIHVSPRANREFALGFTSPALEQYGNTVTEAWKKIAPPNRFLPLDAEDLLTRIQCVAKDGHRAWADWLLERYGWWR